VLQNGGRVLFMLPDASTQVPIFYIYKPKATNTNTLNEKCISLPQSQTMERDGTGDNLFDN